MRKVVLHASAEGTAEFGDRTANTLLAGERLPVNVVVDFDVTIRTADGEAVSEELRDEVLGRMQTVMRREAERFAQIAAVDLRDQPIERAEIARVRQAPAERPVTIVGAGMKDAKTGRVDLWRTKDGATVPASQDQIRKFERENTTRNRA